MLLALRSCAIHENIVSHFSNQVSQLHRHWGYAFLHAAPIRIAEARSEHILVGYFNQAHQLLRIDHIASGEPGTVDIPTRAMMCNALNLSAYGIVLAHNHPSGDPRPSRADITTTRDVARMFHPLQIRIDDHLIVSGDQIFSFRDAGMI